MKIAHILGSLGMGGAERVALDLAFEQKKLGHEVVAVSLSGSPGGPLASAFDADEIQVLEIPKRRGLDWSLPRRLMQQLKQEGVEVVHTHNSQPLVYGAAMGRLSGMAVIHSKHGEGHLVSKPGQLLRRFGSPFVHKFVAVSEATAEHARAQWAYPFPSRIEVITNGIRMERHQPSASIRLEVRRELGIPQDAWLVGTVGRLDDNKNQAALLRAMSLVLGPLMHLIIVGDGDNLHTLRKAAEGAHASSVHVPGHRDDANQILAAMDVFALPSKSEGLPLVILEAMATAVPVVATKVGGIPKVIQEGKTGLLVPANDDEALAEALAFLAANPEKACRMGNAGRKHVLEHYSAERMATEYLALYQAALKA